MIILNNNLDETTMNNIKNMVDSGNINGAISQISPEMIQNFSKMFAQAQNNQQMYLMKVKIHLQILAILLVIILIKQITTILLQIPLIILIKQIQFQITLI